VWADNGEAYAYEELMAAANDERLAFRSLFNPDDPSLLHPADMTRAIREFCARTDQPQPSAPGEYARAILESLAFRYRMVLEALQELTGVRITEIQIVGGGSNNRLLNQFTADATGCHVLAGPVEATALGNIAVQMLATGAVSSLADARGIVAHSFPIERFEPVAVDRWKAHYRRFQQYVEWTCV
jgi:rhamnulokinase